MSEELLKALMQLFAIAAKQDGKISESQRNFVQDFLLQQLDREAAKDYLNLFDDYGGSNKPQITEENKPVRRLTSMRDSVRTLSICRQINQTLTQQQKIVLLIRLLELTSADGVVTALEKEIVDTVSLVFNFEKSEYKTITHYVYKENIYDIDSDDLLVIDRNEQGPDTKRKHIKTENLDGSICILHTKSVDMYFVKYTGNEELLLNGLVISKNTIYPFTYGSTLKLPKSSPVYYSDVVACFLRDKALTPVSFEAINVTYRFPGGNIGLQDINLGEDSGKLIAIMGASGAGKTTLLNVLAGLEKPSAGEILINGINIFTENEKIEGVIGYVSQDDLLIEELTVYQNLYYNAKLCFRDLNEKELELKVLKILGDLGLTERKELKVGNALNKLISGGQRKRLNIALELIREPTVLFLDEPTSGLSSRDSENILDLLKELSSKGKLIFVVIHQPSSDIYKMFDKILILDVGGKPIYYGNPVEAIVYFKKADKQLNSDKGQCQDCGNVNPELIFNIIESKVVDEYGRLTDKRKISPEHWNELYHKKFNLKKIEQAQEAPATNLKIPSKIKQTAIFITRDVLSKLSNTQYMLINFLEAPLLALILAFIIRYIEDPLSNIYKFSENENITAYLFMSIIVALFMGLTVSAEEIIKDRKILKREAFLNLSRFSYLLSKVCILFTISAIQTLTFVLIGNWILEVDKMNLSYWLVLFSVSCFANMLGLNISSSFNSAVTIYILIPILLIPQMILSGAIFSFDKLNQWVGKRDKVPVIADVMTSRWAFEALMTNQFKNNEFEKYIYDLEKAESQTDFKQVYLVPELKDRLRRVETNLKFNKSALPEQYDKDIRLLAKELINESKLTLMAFNYYDNFIQKKIDQTTIDSTMNYLDRLGDYYTDRFNGINLKKEQRLSSMQSTPAKAEQFKRLKTGFDNEYLSDIVTNKSAKYKFIVENDRIIQMIDPIYLPPVHISGILDYRAPFYSSQKHFMNKYFDTYMFNTLVIWLMSITLFLTLYWDALKKLINFISDIKFKKIKK